MTKPIFYEGQHVGCLMLGEGIVGSILNENIFVTLERGATTYFLDGKYYKDSRQTLYPIEQYRAIIANLPAPEPEKWQPKPGEWCWFWDDMKASSMKPVLDRFISMRNGKFQGHYLWDNCAPFVGELPEHLKVKENER